MMMVVVAYDVNTVTAAGRRRLRRVAKACQGWGQRVQNSVFECWMDAAQWVQLRRELLAEIEPEVDSLRFYFLGDSWKGRIEHIGAKETYEADGLLIV